MIKNDLEKLIIEALEEHKGRANIVQVAEFIWGNYEPDLRKSGELFFTWQYDMRWAANKLRRKEVMKPADSSPSGVWELKI
ncbi:hypothetical protein J4G53_24485 [Serratia ureilytica]|uniref:hypothetical protein n=1 Tax=Serratia ureilytica TaxID=300181 RepID=UPI001AA0B620|nr:hypothetical protein [Serratia ureilytica]MBO1811397.1 hypothetical protein [Serratia ureilytica]